MLSDPRRGHSLNDLDLWGDWIMVVVEVIMDFKIEELCMIQQSLGLRIHLLDCVDPSLVDNKFSHPKAQFLLDIQNKAIAMIRGYDEPLRQKLERSNSDETHNEKENCET